MERGECRVVGRCSTQWRREMAATDGSRTVDCLRGRLLAEREASRAAREEAELLMRRLTELERLLAEEIRNRDRAEKRLKCALVKLRSLKLVGGMVASASSEELLSGNFVNTPSISSEGGKSSPNPVGSLGLCDDENGRRIGDGAKDADLPTHAVDSPCGSVRSVNMGSSKHSGECSESKSNSCDLELNGDNRLILLLHWKCTP